MDNLQRLMTLIDNEKENISSNSYLQCCNNLQQLQKQCFIQHNEIKDIDTKVKNMYIKQLENIKLSIEEKASIIKQFCKTYNLKYNIENTSKSIKDFELQMKKDLNTCGPVVYDVFKQEFRDFYNERRTALLEEKEKMLIQRISMFTTT